jgi:hypothetical protein
LLRQLPWREETVSVSAPVPLVGTGRMEATPVGKSVLLKAGGDGASVTLLQGQRRGGVFRKGGVRSGIRLLRRQGFETGSAQGVRSAVVLGARKGAGTLQVGNQIRR